MSSSGFHRHRMFGGRFPAQWPSMSSYNTHTHKAQRQLRKKQLTLINPMEETRDDKGDAKELTNYRSRKISLDS